MVSDPVTVLAQGVSKKDKDMAIYGGPRTGRMLNKGRREPVRQVSDEHVM